MLKGERQNYHHSVLPKIGEIGYLTSGVNRWGETLYFNHGHKQKYQCIAFPLCDNCLPYSRGIHTAIFKSLKDGKIVKMSGFYFDVA